MPCGKAKKKMPWTGRRGAVDGEVVSHAARGRALQRSSRRLPAPPHRVRRVARQKGRRLAQGKLKSKKGELRRVLEGRLTQAQRWVLAELLARLEEPDAALTRMDTR